MKILKDKWVTSSVRYTKVVFHNKVFRRFDYCYQNRTVDVLWLSENRENIPDKLEKLLEEEFKKVG